MTGCDALCTSAPPCHPPNQIAQSPVRIGTPLLVAAVERRRAADRLADSSRCRPMTDSCRRRRSSLRSLDRRRAAPERRCRRNRRRRSSRRLRSPSRQRARRTEDAPDRRCRRTGSPSTRRRQVRPRRRRRRPGSSFRQRIAPLAGDAASHGTSPVVAQPSFDSATVKFSVVVPSPALPTVSVPDVAEPASSVNEKLVGPMLAIAPPDRVADRGDVEVHVGHVEEDAVCACDADARRARVRHVGNDDRPAPLLGVLATSGNAYVNPPSFERSIATFAQLTGGESVPATSQVTVRVSPAAPGDRVFGRVTSNGPAVFVTWIWMLFALTVAPNCGVPGTSWLSRTVRRKERSRVVAGHASPVDERRAEHGFDLREHARATGRRIERAEDRAVAGVALRECRRRAKVVLLPVVRQRIAVGIARRARQRERRVHRDRDFGRQAAVSMTGVASVLAVSTAHAPPLLPIQRIDLLEALGVEVRIGMRLQVVGAADAGVGHDRRAAARFVGGVAGAVAAAAGAGLRVERVVAAELVAHLVGDVVDVEAIAVGLPRPVVPRAFWPLRQVTRKAGDAAAARGEDMTDVVVRRADDRCQGSSGSDSAHCRCSNTDRSPRPDR